MSEGYTAGSVSHSPQTKFKQVVDKVVTKSRIQRLKEEPLKISEFFAPLSKAFFIEKTEYENIRVSPPFSIRPSRTRSRG
jgi:hypothetical protein